MARRPYTTDARFFSDSDQAVKIKWYPVAEPVECLPFPSKINSLDWSSFPYLAKGVGEVYGASRNYNGAKALPYAVGLEPCQPAEVFRDGEKRDPDLPPQVYNEDGFPLCCLDRFTATGGVLWGGAAILLTPIPPPGPCPPVAPILPGEWYYKTALPTDPINQTWYGPIIPGDTYRFRCELLSGGPLTFNISAVGSGACISTRTFAFAFPSGFFDVTAATFLTEDRIFFNQNGAPAGPVNYRVRFDHVP